MKFSVSKTVMLLFVVIMVSYIIISYTYKTSGKYDYYVIAYPGDLIFINISKLAAVPLDYSASFSEPFNQKGIWLPKENDTGRYLIEVNITVPAKNQPGSLVENASSEKSWSNIQNTSKESSSNFQNSTSTSNATRITKRVLVDVKSLPIQPKLESPKLLFIHEGDGLEFGLNARSIEPDDLNITVSGLPENAYLNNGFFYWTPDYGTVTHAILKYIMKVFRFKFPAFKVFKLRFSNNGALPSSESTTWIVVFDTNQPPKISLDKLSFVFRESQDIEFSRYINDSDSDFVSAQLLIKGKKYSLPEKAKLSLNNETAVLLVSDGISRSAAQIVLFIEPKNRTVDFFQTIPNSVKIEEGAEKEFPIAIPEAFNNYSFSISGPSFIKIVGNILLLNPSYDAVKKDETFPVQLNITKDSFSASKNFSIRVINRNRPPEIINFSPQLFFTIKRGETATFSVNSTDSDNDSLSITWDISPFTPKIYNKTDIKVKFLTTGEKRVSVLISDGKAQICKEWIVDVQRFVKYELDKPGSKKEKVRPIPAQETHHPAQPSNKVQPEEEKEDYEIPNPVTVVI